MPTSEEIGSAALAIRTNLRNIARNYEVSTVNRGEYGAMVGHLSDACGHDDDLRRRVIGFLFGLEGTEMSTKYLKPGEMRALIEWIDAYEDDGHWHSSIEFRTQIDIIIKHIGNIGGESGKI